MKPFLLAALGFLGVALVCLAAALWWWDYTRVKIGYDRELTSLYSMPQGVHPLAENEIGGRATTFRIESSQGKVRRVTEINGSGCAVEDSANFGAFTEEIHYRENGGLDYIACLDQNGREVLRETYGDMITTDTGGKRQIVRFKFRNKDVPSAMALNFSLLGFNVSDSQATINDVSNTRSDIAGEILDYTPEGRIARVQFLNADDVAFSNVDGLYGQRFGYDQAGLITRVENLDAEGQLVTDKYGAVTMTRTYDAVGNEVEERYFDANKAPVGGWFGCARWTAAFDENGNWTERKYFDDDGNLAINGYGYACERAGYDEHGNQTSVAYLGPNGHLTSSPSGRYARWTAKYDAAGNAIEWDYFGVDGQPTLNQDGICVEKITFDRHGNNIEESYFGLDGRPVLSNGYAKMTARFDASGNDIEDAFFGTDGQLILDKDALAGIKTKYDDRGLQLEESYTGVKGEPAVCASSDGSNFGWTKLTWKHDDLGNLVEEAYFDANGKPVISNHGYARMTYKYDHCGHLIEQAMFDLNGQPVLNYHGAARLTWSFDQRGNKIEEADFGVDGRLIVDSNDGFAYAEHQFDAHNQKTEDRYFGPDAKPIEVNGVCRIVYTYDTSGDMVKTERYNALGTLVP